MRVYAREHACGFRFTREAWGELSNFHPLAAPIAAGPFRFGTSEALYQAAKFGARPDVQRRIAEAPAPKKAAAIGRTPGFGIDPGWNAQRVDVMRGVLRMKREADRAGIDAVLAATGERAIVEVSTCDPRWGAQPLADRYEGRNVLGGCGWSFATSFASTTPRPAPAPGRGGSASAASRAPLAGSTPPRRPSERRRGSESGSVPLLAPRLLFQWIGPVQIEQGFFRNVNHNLDPAFSPWLAN